MAKGVMGRESIFRGKTRRLGPVTPEALTYLEAYRTALGLLYASVMGRSPNGSISDGDVTEFVLRGHTRTLAYLRAEKKKEGA